MGDFGGNGKLVYFRTTKCPFENCKCKARIERKRQRCGKRQQKASLKSPTRTTHDKDIPYRQVEKTKIVKKYSGVRYDTRSPDVRSNYECTDTCDQVVNKDCHLSVSRRDLRKLMPSYSSNVSNECSDHTGQGRKKLNQILCLLSSNKKEHAKVISTLNTLINKIECMNSNESDCEMGQVNDSLERVVREFRNVNAATDVYQGNDVQTLSDLIEKLNCKVSALEKSNKPHKMSESCRPRSAQRNPICFPNCSTRTTIPLCCETIDVGMQTQLPKYVSKETLTDCEETDNGMLQICEKCKHGATEQPRLSVDSSTQASIGTQDSQSQVEASKAKTPVRSQTAVRSTLCTPMRSPVQEESKCCQTDLIVLPCFKCDSDFRLEPSKQPKEDIFAQTDEKGFLCPTCYRKKECKEYKKEQERIDCGTDGDSSTKACPFKSKSGTSGFRGRSDSGKRCKFKAKPETIGLDDDGNVSDFYIDSRVKYRDYLMKLNNAGKDKEGSKATLASNDTADCSPDAGSDEAIRYMDAPAEEDSPPASPTISPKKPLIETVLLQTRCPACKHLCWDTTSTKELAANLFACALCHIRSSLKTATIRTIHMLTDEAKGSLSGKAWKTIQLETLSADDVMDILNDPNKTFRTECPYCGKSMWVSNANRPPQMYKCSRCREYFEPSVGMSQTWEYAVVESSQVIHTVIEFIEGYRRQQNIRAENYLPGEDEWVEGMFSNGFYYYEDGYYDEDGNFYGYD